MSTANDIATMDSIAKNAHLKDKTQKANSNMAEQVVTVYNDKNSSSSTTTTTSHPVGGENNKQYRFMQDARPITRDEWMRLSAR